MYFLARVSRSTVRFEARQYLVSIVLYIYLPSTNNIFLNFTMLMLLIHTCTPCRFLSVPSKSMWYLTLSCV